MPELEVAGCLLAGGDGSGKPEITADVICFNGLEKCGHPENAEIVIPWPTKDAGGIANPSRENAHHGDWFAGAQIQKRCCNGSCSYETFLFARRYKSESWQKPENGRYFDFCKTAFRPYDLAVICCLIVIKHHCGERVEVSSDGEDGQWFDGKLFCQVHLGYGMEYAVNSEGDLVRVAREAGARRGRR